MLLVGDPFEEVAGLAVEGSPDGFEGAEADGFGSAVLEDCDVGACEAGDTEAALAAYESDLFPRAEQSAAESAANLDLCFAPDAPIGLLNFFSTIG